MALKTNFDDPSSRTGVYVGDLRYGRCYGNEYRKHNDYPAHEGDQVNLPAVPLVLKSKRDPRIWNGKSKHPKVKCNSKSFTDQVMMKIGQQTGGLLHNLKVIKLGSHTSVMK